MHDIINRYSSMTQSVIDGELDPIKVYGEISVLIKHLKKCQDQTKGAAIDEAEKHEKAFESNGFKFERKQGGKAYSFKHIPKWVELNDEVKKFEEQSKQAYASFQKGIQSATQDGEEIILPEVTYRADSLSVKL